MSLTRGINLNTLAPRASAGFDWGAQARGVSAGAVTVHFGDVATAVEAFIRDSPMLVGCVAWVRSKRLVAALAERPVALVVNKEFALRTQGRPEREALMPLRGGVPSVALPAPRPRTDSLEAARCAGWAVKGKFGALMHHKFLVRLDADGAPVAVWTGSFNLTAGAESNIENGMTITDPVVAAAFLAEFARVWALSEPLTFTAGTPTPGSTAAGTVRVPVKRARKTPAKRKAPAKKASTVKKPATAKTTTANPATTKTTPRASAGGKKATRTSMTRRTR